MHRRAILLVVLVLFAPLAAATPASADSTQQVTLEMRILDNNGNAIGNADVTVEFDGNQKTTTSLSNGLAAVDVPQGSDVTITVTHNRYVKNFPKEVDDVTGSTRIVEVTMFPEARAEIAVRDEDGNQIEDAEVRLRKKTDGRNENVASGRTDGNGIYKSPRIEQGTYEVFAVKQGYFRQVVDVDVSGTTGERITLSEGSASVTLEVTDGYLEEGIKADVIVTDSGEQILQATTAENGERSVNLGVNGQYTFTVEKDGYESTSRTEFIGENDKTVSFAIRRSPDLTVTAANDRVLIGERVLVTVRDEYDERAAGVTVLRDGSEVGTTDENGEIRVQIDSRGDHTLQAESDEATSEEITVEGVEAAPDETPTPTPTATPDEETPTPSLVEELPGFGPVVALIGLAAGLLALRRRD